MKSKIIKYFVALLNLLTKKIEFRKVYAPTASGLVTISLSTKTQKTTIYTGMHCKIQVRAGWFWLTIRNYYISVGEYSKQKPAKIKFGNSYI